jgi:hypothetical protein
MSSSIRICKAIFGVALVFLLSSCLSTTKFEYTDLSAGPDQDLPTEVLPWLEQGPQTNYTDMIEVTGLRLQGLTRRERLYRITDYFYENFHYDTWQRDQIFKRTSAQIFAERQLGDCSDYALISAALLRAAGIPSRLVLTANKRWLRTSANNPLAITTGHVFIEVFLEDDWHLVDVPYRKLFSGYDPRNINYPRGELFCIRGLDYWSLGIRSATDLNTLYAKLTVNLDPNEYEKPRYLARHL